VTGHGAIGAVSTERTVTFKYPRPPADVLKLLLDPEFVTGRSRAMGESDIQVTTRRDGERVVIVNQRDVRRELPAFARKLFSPVNRVTQTESWDPRGATPSGSYVLEVRGAPVTVRATFELRPDGAGSEYRITYQVTVKIPLIGGKLEAYTLEQTVAGVQKELEYTATALGRT
jgi:hypothetical protein